jgi:hypothetical protein
MTRLPPLIERHPPVMAPDVPGTARVQCVSCRWHGTVSEMRQTFVYRPGESRVCPQCCAVKMRFLEDGESPLAPFPMQAQTLAWLKLGGFEDWGMEKGLRIFAHRETTPRLLLKLPPETTIPEVLSLNRQMGSEDQAERTRQAWRELVTCVRRGKALPEAEPLADLLLPAAAAESAADEDWEFLRQGDNEQ